MSTPEQNTAAPGWYETGHGTISWWDGTTWTGHSQPIMTVERAGAFSASFAWWGAFIAGFIPAWIIFATNKPTKAGTNTFARYSAGEALNTQLTVLVAMLPLQALYVWWLFTSFASPEYDPAAGPPASFLAVWGISMAFSFALWALYALAAVRAHRGVWFEARYAIPFLRAHRKLRPGT